MGAPFELIKLSNEFNISRPPLRKKPAPTRIKRIGLDLSYVRLIGFSTKLSCGG